jgi:hypothetical protein
MEVNSPEGGRRNSRMVEKYTPKFSFAMDYQLGEQHRHSKLSAGTYKNTLPGLDKDIFKGRDPIELGFQWKAVQDGYNKDSWVKAGRKQCYAIHVLAEKKDKSLANVLVNALIISPSLFRNSALEFRMAPLYQRENGPAEKLKFLESLKEHAYLQEHLMSVTIPDLLSLDIRAQ